MTARQKNKNPLRIKIHIFKQYQSDLSIIVYRRFASYLTLQLETDVIFQQPEKVPDFRLYKKCRGCTAPISEKSLQANVVLIFIHILLALHSHPLKSKKTFGIWKAISTMQHTPKAHNSQPIDFNDRNECKVK